MKINTFNYPYSHSLPPPHPCFLPVQPYTEDCLVSTNVSDGVDIENMTIAEYNLYVVKRDKKYSGLDEVLDDLFRIGEEVQVKDGDDGDIYDIWDITVSEIEWIMQFLTTNMPDVMDDVIQPLIPKTLHTTPPDEDYVAPTTKSILDELLEELGDEILNVTMVDEEADFNPTYDIEELERLLAKDPQSYLMEIQVHSVIIKPNEELEPFIHT
ncbi:hypothetical protein Tco_0121062 [Tanacetum coccineum]